MLQVEALKSIKIGNILGLAGIGECGSCPNSEWVESQPDLDPDDKTDLQSEVDELETAVKNRPDAVEASFIAKRLRNIERIAPDIIDVILATVANPAAGLGVVGAKIKAKADEIRAKRG